MKISVGQKIKSKIYRFQEILGLRYFTRKQKYNVTHSTKITNVRAISNTFAVIVPLPSNNEYQKVISDVKSNFAPETFETEKKSNNYYGIWKFALQPNETREILVSYFVQVKPQKKYIPSDILLSDYNRDDDYAMYTRSSSSIDISSSKLITTAQNIAIKTDNVLEIVSEINEYVINNLKYGNPIRGLHSAEFALVNKCVDCGGFDTLFVALCRVKGIPSRIVSGFWTNYPGLGNKDIMSRGMHAWVEIMLPDGSWVSADPASEHLRRQARTKRSGVLGKVGSDRITLSVDCDIKIEIDNIEFEIPILQHAFVASQTQANDMIIYTEFVTKRK